MAIYDMHRSTALPVSTIWASRFADAVLSVLDRATAPRPVKRAKLELSDWQLRDLGLERAELDRL